jgi:hypothetical protein
MDNREFTQPVTMTFGSGWPVCLSPMKAGIVIGSAARRRKGKEMSAYVTRHKSPLSKSPKKNRELKALDSIR